MEKLNEYLQILLSTCGYELQLEPNKIPRVVSDGGTTDVANAPLLGTQISMLVFPLIPPAVKQELPNKSEIEFVHNHALGVFNFTVKKSPVGFFVTIRPVFSDVAAAAAPPLSSANSVQSPPPTFVNMLAAETTIEPPPPESPPLVPPVAAFSNQTNQENAVQNTSARDFSFADVRVPDIAENPTDYSTAEIEIEETVYKTDGAPEIETVPAYDAEFSTVFSDYSTYEPPVRPQELASVADHATPQVERAFENETRDFQSNQFVQTVETVRQPQAPASSFSSAAAPAANANPQMRERMDALFRRMADAGASDLHLSATMPPLVRKDGKIQKLECAESVLTPETTKQLLTAIMPVKNREEFERRRDTDFAYEIERLARFRANVFLDRKGMGAVFRIIPTKILTAEQLGLSKEILNLCDLSKGLVVVTGPTGSGKSTTLCAMVNHINLTREDHIITIEDPIEFTHENQKCLVNQREVHNHTNSFKDALRAALREDPDILLVGEMRDLETISIAIETAETGHLVFGTLHTTTAASTVDRIIDQFPADRQQQIRVMLSESLKGVIAQTLLPKKGGGRIAALEVLIVTPAISNLIREGKTFQIPSAMQTGKAHGMVMLNDALFELVSKGLVEPRDAYVRAVDKTNFEALLSRNGMKI